MGEVELGEGNPQAVPPPGPPEVVYVYFGQAEGTVTPVLDPEAGPLFVGYLDLREGILGGRLVLPIIANGGVVVSILHDQLGEGHALSHLGGPTLAEGGLGQFGLAGDDVVIIVVLLNRITGDLVRGSDEEKVGEPEFDDPEVDFAGVDDVLVLVVHAPAPFEVGLLALQVLFLLVVVGHALNIKRPLELQLLLRPRPHRLQRRGHLEHELLLLHRHPVEYLAPRQDLQILIAPIVPF